MKKISLSFLVLISFFILAACNKDGGSNSNDPYSISYESNSNYQVSDLVSEAKTGEVVDFKVEVTNIFYEITKVSANSQVLFPSNGNYTFTMPSEDVTIKIELGKVSESETGNVSFSKTTPSTISLAEDKTVSYFVEQDLVVQFSEAASPYITNVTSEILVENENVIPSSALRYEDITATSSNIIKGGKLVVDLKQINIGETLIYLNLKPNNGSLGTIIKKIKVVEYGQVELETMEVTFRLENKSNYPDEELFINFIDQEFIYGSEHKETDTIYFRDFVDGTYTFTYVVGHTYVIYGGSITGDGVTLAEWVGSGSSTTGYNSYQNNILTLITPNVEVPFTFVD